MWAHQAVWWPVGMAWLTVQFFDNETIRELLYYAVTVSFGGPFLLYWVGLAFAMVYTQANDDFGNLWTYIWLAIYSAWSLLNIIWQVLMVPKVYEWIETAAYTQEEWEGEDLIDDEDKNYNNQAIKAFEF